MRWQNGKEFRRTTLTFHIGCSILNVLYQFLQHPLVSLCLGLEELESPFLSTPSDSLFRFGHQKIQQLLVLMVAFLSVPLLVWLLLTSQPPQFTTHSEFQWKRQAGP